MLRVLAIPSFLFLCHAVCLAEGTVGKEAAPEWVIANDSPIKSVGGDEDGAVRYLLVDLQRHAEEKATYEAFATRVLTQAGVENLSQLSVDFQPSYQSVAWHHLDVIRGGEKQDRLASAEFELIRREEGLESRLYDGMITAHVILKDIRPGDIISYSFTTKGENPVLSGHIQGNWSMGYSVPVDRVRRSLIWNPEVRTMAWQLNGLEQKGREENLPGGLRRISYEREHPPKITAEKNTPSWFAAYPYLEISDYGNWEVFGKWSSELYAAGASLPPELKEVCDVIRKEGGTPQEQALKALRWSQQNIRYLGSFFGEHTHAPYPLELICSRRFGDCKDKGMLTVALLRELGFDAAPALVDTDLHATVAEMLPGHACFDHLIVHLRLGGKVYWLDPTRTFQRGKLDELYSPEYGYAFVIRDGENALTAVKSSGFAEAGIDILEKFNITDDAGNGTLTVRTVFAGVNADSMRRTLADEGRAELEKQYRDHYAKDYPALACEAPLTVTDDEAANLITTEETYRLKDFLNAPETPGGSATGSVYARNIGDYLGIPEETERISPLYISHPTRRSQTIEITIPKNWDMDTEEFSRSLAAAEYRYRIHPDGRTLQLRHDYKSLASHVEPAEYAAYTKAMKDANNRLYFEFSYPIENVIPEIAVTEDVDESQFVKSRALLGVFVIIGIVLGVIATAILYFWDPHARESTMLNPRAIGGWLVLPTIGCFILPIVSIIFIGSFFSNIGEGNVNLFPGSGNADMWRLYYCSSILIEGILFPLAILQITLLLTKRTSFPYFYIGYGLIQLGSLLLAFALQSTVDTADSPEKVIGEATGHVARLAIWGSYMLVSQRVRATFVHRRRKKLMIQPPPLPLQAGG